MHICKHTLTTGQEKRLHDVIQPFHLYITRFQYLSIILNPFEKKTSLKFSM